MLFLILVSVESTKSCAKIIVDMLICRYYDKNPDNILSLVPLP